MKREEKMKKEEKESKKSLCITFSYKGSKAIVFNCNSVEEFPQCFPLMPLCLVHLWEFSQRIYYNLFGLMFCVSSKNGFI